MKHGRFLLALTLAVVLGAVLAGCGGAPRVDWELEISGAVDNPLSLSYGDLAAMEQVDLSDVLMEKSMGEDEVRSWSGAALEDIFEQAQVSPDYASVTATAADGYAVEISRDELAGAIVALKDGAGWIATTDPEHGPIRLVCPQTPANRWVFQLQELVVNE